MKSIAYIIIACLLSLNCYMAGWSNGWNVGKLTGEAECELAKHGACFLHNGKPE